MHTFRVTPPVHEGKRIDRQGQPRLRLAGAIALSGLLLASLVGFSAAPALARTCGPVTIENGAASPGSGTTATTFHFSVDFEDADNDAPQSVRLRIDGGWTNLTASGSFGMAA